MPDYSKGKIYKIYSNSVDLVYYGSTTQSLKDRLSGHEHSDGCSSKKIITTTNDYKIELVENYPCSSKYELELRESYYIENNKCINDALPPCCLIVKPNYYNQHKNKMTPLMKNWSLTKPKIRN